MTPAEERRLEAAPRDYSDIPPLGKEFFTKATDVWPPTKEQVTVRLDVAVLTWLKAHGRGYQTRLNRILRAAMEGQPSTRARTAGAPKKRTRLGRSI
ncbi:MAG: BrnA antitoxin family protein [Nitrospira sp.]|nr:BrnA antitoxin family protein [Nitrospira sp.]